MIKRINLLLKPMDFFKLRKVLSIVEHLEFYEIVPYPKILKHLIAEQMK